MNTCVSWQLLLSHAVLLGTSGFGIWLAVDNFDVGDLAPPSPPAVTTTTTPPLYKSYDYNNRRNEPSEAFKDYVDKTEKYARLNEDARLYVTVVCGVGAATSAVLLLAGLCSRKLFTTTASLYSSLGVWSLTLVSILGYQSTFFSSEDKIFPGAFWVLIIQVAMMLQLSLQLLLAMWELRRQKTGWPTVNITHLFTLDAIMLVARMTLAVYVSAMLFHSPVTYGLRKKCGDYNEWQCPVEPYPLWLGISSLVAAAYSSIVSGEAVLSFFFGTLHTHVAWSTSLISAVCNGWVAVIVSPLFIKTFVGPYTIYPDQIILPVITSIVTFIHTTTCLFAPRVMRTPPKFIQMITDKLSTQSLGEILKMIVATGPMSSSTNDIQKKAAQLKEMINVTPEIFSNFLLSVASVVFIIILGSSWWGPMYRIWGAIVLLAVNLSVLCRTIPPLVLHLYCSQNLVVPFAQRVVRQAMEGLVVLVGSLSTFVQSYDSAFIVVGVFQLAVTIIQTLLLANEYVKLRKQAGVAGDADQLLEEESEVEGEDSTTPSPEKLVHDPVSLA